MREMTGEQMQHEIDNGDAQTLMPEGVPGPVHYEGRWWFIPQGATTYREADFDTEDALYDMAIRLSAGTRAVREAKGEATS